MRLIDADELWKEIESVEYYGCDAEVSRICGLIQNAPTVEVKPIVYGKWIYLYDFDGLEICECNKCGVSQEFDGGIFDVNSRRANFCPHCGAKMKKKREEEE